MSRINDNVELNKLLGIKSIFDSVGGYKKAEPLIEECQIKRPRFAHVYKDGLKRAMDLHYAVFFDCPICAIGKILADTRISLRYSTCSNCSNVFAVRKNAGGEFKMVFRPNIMSNSNGCDW